MSRDGTSDAHPPRASDSQGQNRRRGDWGTATEVRAQRLLDPEFIEYPTPLSANVCCLSSPVLKTGNALRASRVLNGFPVSAYDFALFV